MPPNGKLEQRAIIHDVVRSVTTSDVVDLCEAGRYREASALLSFLSPEHAPLAFGMVETAIGNQETARDYLTRDGSEKGRVQMAVSYWRSGEVQEARAVLKTLPESFDRFLVQAIINESSPKRVLKLLDKASKYEVVHGKQARLHNTRAIALRELKEFDRALQEFEAALYYFEEAKSDCFPLILKNVSRVYSQTGEFDRAHQLVDRAITLLSYDDSYLAQGYDQKALIYLDAWKPEAAWQFADKAVRVIERTDKKAWQAKCLITRAKTLSHTGRFTAALSDLDRAETLGVFLNNHEIVMESCNEKWNIANEIQSDADIGRIEAALRITSVRDAAKKLQIEDHQILMRLIKKYGIDAKNISHTRIEKRKSSV